MEGLFRLRVVTPERIFFEGEVAMTEFTSTEGQLGILGRHAPLTAVVSPGILTIHRAKEVRKAALLSGFAVITGEEMTILSGAVEWPEEIDISRAEKARIRAEERLRLEEDGADLLRAELALKKAVARLSLGGR